MIIEKIARIAHEVNAAYFAATTGAPRLPWEQQSPEYQTALRAEVVALVEEHDPPAVAPTAPASPERTRQAIFTALVHALRDGSGQAHINHHAIGDLVIAGKRQVLPASQHAGPAGETLIKGGGSQIPEAAPVTAVMFRQGMVMYEVGGVWHEAGHVFKGDGA